ncbi:hypothetical protein HELRODRAFT_192032 [Helobdella robusta]|uniref:RNA-binding protein NOB1 n=1 Tax=Helobdella robusta TaxID=6412 RepID=T1FTI8_HELRO|nr:hypothetical protein HELRODRAFT_192032 [Helobdella robusta]ESO03424.1 hypothetical protein HELRODRAFT_192032 [Helobdella robusta]
MMGDNVSNNITRGVLHLVVDSAGFIRNAPLKDLGENIYTIQEVVSEIKDPATRMRLQVLPYDLNFRCPSHDSIKAVTDFSKKTGDYQSLSAVDLRVLALTYQLEVEHVGKDHIKTASTKTVKCEIKNSRTDPLPIGFYSSKKQKTTTSECQNEILTPANTPAQQHELNDDNNNNNNEEDVGKNIIINNTNDDDGNKGNNTSDVANICTNNNNIYNGGNYSFERNNDDSDGKFGIDICKLSLALKNAAKKDGESDENEERDDDDGDKEEETCSADDSHDDDDNDDDDKSESEEDFEGETTMQGDVANEGDDDDEEEEEEEEDDKNKDDDDDDDDGGWVTVSNIKSLMKSNPNQHINTVNEQIVVACLTTDFAMQNVLIQMGLRVLSVDGLLIKQTKNYVLRCHACLKITKNMMKKFCSHCGNQTLQKVSMSIAEDGSVVCHLSKYKIPSARGTRYSLPMPKGGKYNHDPILCEDQLKTKQRTKKMSKVVDVFDPDYLGLSSPFALNDVTSRATSLGFNKKSRRSDVVDVFDGRRKNPNESRKKTGRRK